MKLRIEIPSKRIADIITNAVELPHNSMTRAWCGGVELKGRWAKDPKIKAAQFWYADVPALYESQFVVDIIECDEGKPPVTHHRNQEHLKQAFELMATKHAQHFAAFMRENEDNITADVLLQLFAFGEVRYG